MFGNSKGETDGSQVETKPAPCSAPWLFGQGWREPGHAIDACRSVHGRSC